MHLRLDQPSFQRELGLVLTAVERRHTIPVLSYVRVEARDGKVWVTGTDLETSIRVGVEAEVREGGAVCLPARKLYDIVRSVEGSIEVKVGENRAVLASGRSRFTLAGLEVEEFPEVPAVPEGGHRMGASAWRDGIERVIFATTMEETRYALMGVNVEWWDGGVRLVATDGFRLALWETAQAPSERRSCLVPRKAIAGLRRLIESSDEDVEFAADDHRAYFRVGGRELVSRLLSGQFPNYEMVIPRDADKRAVVSGESFGDACRRVGILADERSRAVTLSFSPGRVVLTARSAEVGEEAVDEVECDYGGEAVEITFNWGFLDDFLGVVSGDVEIAFTDSQKPVLFRPRGEAERYLYVLVPMRVS